MEMIVKFPQESNPHKSVAKDIGSSQLSES